MHGGSRGKGAVSTQTTCEDGDVVKITENDEGVASSLSELSQYLFPNVINIRTHVGHSSCPSAPAKLYIHHLTSTGCGTREDYVK
jgi:hypothetical protein